eukprot:CAMPEP_0195283624 /NCGR_PEP_ID=MMETSP0707-20130614/2100_1 /TAXON_ID=33640 /ORGANISM="Asterionellopsis glacialis, Strain CCMP134" /LENGTH=432 /DNA_ID=CAMNT_0040342815 /DNA_START=34 /DNA_END=1332 /DNA_ORIENTATION=+
METRKRHQQSSVVGDGEATKSLLEPLIEHVPEKLKPMLLCSPRHRFAAAIFLVVAMSAATFSLVGEGALSRDSALSLLRTLSIDLGNGQCQWTEGQPVDQDAEVFRTLISAYPGSGKRVAFLQLEGLTGLTTGDDFDLSIKNANTKFAFIKTSYPQHEGIWTQQGGMDQALLIIRNPRWAIPAYHHMLYEINYAKTWEEAYASSNNVYTMRSPVEAWYEWRNKRAIPEIHWWGWFIDFWMEGGLMRDIFTHRITTPEHFEMLMQPSQFTESELSFETVVGENATILPSYDYNCIMYLPDGGCKAKTVIQYEKLVEPSTGPAEANKMAATIVGKPGIEVIAEEARECVWEELIINRKGLRTSVDRDGNGPPREAFALTHDQMVLINYELNRVKEKYSSGEWVTDPAAQDLVASVNMYIAENENEIEAMVSATT